MLRKFIRSRKPRKQGEEDVKEKNMPGGSGYIISPRKTKGKGERHLGH